MAMILGLLSQGSGSLLLYQQQSRWWQAVSLERHTLEATYSTSGILPLWRFSPFLCGLESLFILTYLMIKFLGGTTHVHVCYELFVKRTQSSQLKGTKTDLSRKPKVEVIIPICVQILKLLYIRGAPFTKAIVLLYWTNWALVEYLHLVTYFRRTSLPEQNDDVIPGTNYVILRIGVCLCLMLPYGFFIFVSTQQSDVNKAGSFLGVSLLFAAVSCGFLFASLLHGFNVIPVMATCSFVLGIVYYGYLYSPNGTYKPGWLDWLG